MTPQNYTSLEEAEALVVGIARALDELRRHRPTQCQEQAVAYRFDALIGILDITLNDAKQMRSIWESEEAT